MSKELFVAEQKLGVQNVHLVTGEDIIGTVFFRDDEDGPTLVILKPMIPTMGQNAQNGSFQVSLLPLRPYLGDLKEVPIPVDKVVFHVTVTDQMAELYQRFTSDIILAPAGALPSAVPPSILANPLR